MRQVQDFAQKSLRFRSCAFWLVGASVLIAQNAPPLNVLTANYDTSRANANLRETILSTLNVNPAQFGKLFSLPVQGFVNAQPLYMQGLTFAGGSTHNVVFAATHHNDVYAFDADAQGPSLWHVNLGPSIPGTDYGLTDLVELGVMSTPVIDATTNTIYVVAATKENGAFIYRLHALDVTSGQEKLMGPTVITATVPGHSGFDSRNGVITFTPGDQLNRPGLVLANNVVYVAFGSHNDTGMWHGWFLGYNAANIQQQVSAMSTSPDGWGASIWQGGRAPAVDAEGNIYFSTGNGTFDGKRNWGESVVKLSAASGSLMDWFTPAAWSHLNDLDNDFGSCGPLLTSTGWVIAGGKEGVIYLMDHRNLGHSRSDDGQVLQHFQAIGYGIYSMAYWDRRGGPILYLRATGGALKAFKIGTNYFQTTPISQAPFTAGLPLDGMAVSANGSDAYSGIMWLTSTTNGNENGPGTLHAFNALDLSKELWNSDRNAARDSLGTLGKFAAPTVANGKVYVATFSGSLMVYGLLSQTALIGQIVNAASGLGGPIAPGEMIAIAGADLGPSAVASSSSAVAKSGTLSRQLGGTQVLFNGNAAPLLNAGAGQVTAVVPDSVAGQAHVSVQVQYKGQTTGPMSVPVTSVAPGLFTANGAGNGQGAILNQDETINSAANPAQRGSIVSLFGTGQGPTDPDWPDDELARPPYPQLTSRVSVTIGGKPAEITYAGAAPDLAAVFVINARIPASVKPGNSVPVVVTIGGVPAQSGVTVAVR